MTKILFICHGNICRSPMAEFILKNMAAEAGISDQVEIASAAVSREEIGSPVYPPARQVLEQHQIPCGQHTARQITLKDCDYYDRIYYMDRDNVRFLLRMLPNDPTKFHPLLPRDIADPWYTGDFEQTLADLLEGCQKIMEDLV